MPDVPLLQVDHLSKSYGGLLAVDDVSFQVNRGEVLALLGHNGAGKSTVVGILSGAVTPDHARIRINGELRTISSPHAARNLGIETIYQKLGLADNLSAAGNVFLGREIRRWRFFRDDRRMNEAALDVLKRLSSTFVTVDKPALDLSGGQRQLIAIARALHFQAKILIMDEPTAALGPKESGVLRESVANLKAEGVGLILVSHDMHEVFELADRVVVMSNGGVVGTRSTRESTKEEILEMIILGQASPQQDKAKE